MSKKNLNNLGRSLLWGSSTSSAPQRRTPIALGSACIPGFGAEASPNEGIGLAAAFGSASWVYQNHGNRPWALAPRVCVCTDVQWASYIFAIYRPLLST